MTIQEIVAEVSYSLGLSNTENVEGLSIEQAVLVAFRELKRYIRTPVDKTVPYATRISLPAVGIVTKKVMSVLPFQPRIGLTMSSLDSGNVFQVAAAVNVYSAIGQTSSINIDPIMTEMAMAQVRNTLATDFQWSFDSANQVIYIAHRDPRPSMVTIRYVPDFKDVSEIVQDSWIDYLVRLSTAHAKRALGEIRSKYTVEGSNVGLNGEALLTEANTELETLRTELEARRTKFRVLN